MNPELRDVIDEMQRSTKEAAISVATIRTILVTAGLVTEKEYDIIRARMSTAIDEAIEEKKAEMLKGV